MYFLPVRIKIINLNNLYSAFKSQIHPTFAIKSYLKMRILIFNYYQIDLLNFIYKVISIIVNFIIGFVYLIFKCCNFTFYLLLIFLFK